MRYFSLIILLFTGISINAQSWEPIGAGVTRSDSNYDAVMALYPYHGKLYIGGKFVYSGKRKVNSLACWNGIKIDTVGTGLDSIVCAFAEYNGELCIGGGFYKKMPERKRAANIILWNDSTGGWTAMGAGFDVCPSCPNVRLVPTVRTLCMYNRDLYAGGRFFGKGQPNFIAKWDGPNWEGFASLSKNAKMLELEEVYAISVFNQKIYIGSLAINFNIMRGNPIATWDGSNMAIVGKGLNKGDRSSEDGYSHFCAIRVFAVYNGNLYAGGTFDTAGGKRICCIAKWNDTNWSALGTGIRGQIYSMAVYDGKLYVGGQFDSAGGKPAENIAVWDGKSWSAVGDGLQAKKHNYFKGRVAALAVYKNELYAGGTFDFSGDTKLCNLAKLKLDGHSGKPKPAGKNK